MNSAELIIHLCTLSAWQAAQQQGSYQADSLSEIGFIHLSRPDQILQVANAFYRGLPNLVLLWVDPSRLHAELRWEQVDEVKFPHLYGALNIDAVSSVSNFVPDPDGVFRRI
jgi:uncharacterized protein (DUF952 family)